MQDRMDIKPVLKQAQRRWKPLSVLALFLALSPVLFKAPAAGTRQLITGISDSSRSTASKLPAIKAARVLFTAQPWSRRLILDEGNGLELWLRLLHLQDAATAEQAAHMIHSIVSHSPDGIPPTAARRLAAALTLPVCQQRCQGSLLLALSKLASKPGALQQLVATSGGKDSLAVLQQWAGLSSTGFKVDPYISSAAAGVLTNIAALPAGRAELVRQPQLVLALIQALQLTPGHSSSASHHAARILANLAPDPLLAEGLSQTEHMDKLLARLVLCIEQGSPQQQVACAMAISNLASTSDPAQEALAALEAPRLLISHLSGAQSGAVQMAVIQAVLSMTQHGRRWALPSESATTTALTSVRQHNVPGQMLSELAGRALSSSAASGAWSELQGVMLCSEAGSCYSIHHTPGSDAEAAISAALSDVAGDVSCTHIAARFASGLEDISHRSAVAQPGSLQQVSCYGMRSDGGRESVAWTVSRVDDEWQGLLQPLLSDQSWVKNARPRGIWSFGSLRSSLDAYQTMASARIVGLWQNRAWPWLQPLLASTGNGVLHGVRLLGTAIRSMGLMLQGASGFLWQQLGLPLCRSLSGLASGVWELVFAPVISSLSAGFAWLGAGIYNNILAPSAEFVGVVLSTIGNAMYAATAGVIGLVLEYIVQPIMSAVLLVLSSLWQHLFNSVLAPIGGWVLALGSGALLIRYMVADLRNKMFGRPAAFQ